MELGERWRITISEADVSVLGKRYIPGTVLLILQDLLFRNCQMLYTHKYILHTPLWKPPTTISTLDWGVKGGVGD